MFNNWSPLINTEFDSIDQKNTTGLFEYLLKKTNGTPKKIIITICGLVGDVCVMHSFLQGISLWDNIYKPKFPEGTTCDFQIDLGSTYFLGLGGVGAGFGNPSNIDKYIEFYKPNIPTGNNNKFNLDKLTASAFVTTQPKHVGGKRCKCSKCQNKRTKKNKSYRKNRKSKEN